MQGESVIARASPKRRGGADLAQQGRGCHLPPGHPVNGVIEEEAGDVFPAIGGMQDLCRSDCRQVPISLVGDDELVRASSFNAGCAGWCAPMRGLHIAQVKVVVREYRATHRADENGLILHSEVLDCLGDQLVRYAVSASRAIMSLVLQF